MFNLSSAEQANLKAIHEENQKKVRAAWTLLDAIRQNMGVDVRDREGMQKVMRAYALEVVRQQSYANPESIVVGKQTVIKFPNKEFTSKAAYLQHHSRDGAWADDPLIFAALESLGYQPVMHLPKTEIKPYIPFVQQCSDKPLKIEIVNYGATRGGFHWERKGQANQGGGNCGFYTMADQVMVDFGMKQPEINQEEVKTIRFALNATDVPVSTSDSVAPVKMPIVDLQQQKVQEENVYTREVAAQFKVMEEATEGRRKRALTSLDKKLTEELVSLYQQSMKTSDYLTGRLKAIEQEWGCSSEKNVVRTAVETGKIDLDFEDLIRKELLHALSVKAGITEKPSQEAEKALVSCAREEIKPVNTFTPKLVF